MSGQLDDPPNMVMADAEKRAGSLEPREGAIYQTGYDAGYSAAREDLASPSPLGREHEGLTEGEVQAILRNLPNEPGFHLGFGGNFNAAVAKLRARLDRKDDEA